MAYHREKQRVGLGEAKKGFAFSSVTAAMPLIGLLLLSSYFAYRK